MIEKSLIVVLFIYAVSFSLLGAQFIWGDVFHVTMTDFNGQPFKHNLINDINIDTINSVTGPLAANGTSTILTTADYLGKVANIGLDLFELVTGTYIFDLLFQLGVPLIFITGFLTLYLFLLVRSILGWVRGI